MFGKIRAMHQELTGGEVATPREVTDPVRPEVVIIVSGGVVQDVCSSSNEPRPLIWLVDWDNINDRSGRETPPS